MYPARRLDLCLRAGERLLLFQDVHSMTHLRLGARPMLLVVLLTLSALVPEAAMAARLGKNRLLDAERLPLLTSMSGLAVLPQDAASVLIVDPRMAMGPNFSVAMVSNPSITGGTFAGGAAAGAAGALISTAVVEGQWQSVRDEVTGLLHAIDSEQSWESEHAAWSAMLGRTLHDELGVAGAWDSARGRSEASATSVEDCIGGDHCMVALTRWGLSTDARHLEVHVQLMAWSPSLRAEGKSRRRAPDFTNVLVYRSAPLDLPAEKTKQDAELLKDAAMRVYRAQGINDLVKVANDKKHPDANEARKQANRLLTQHRLRLKDAKRGKWTDESLAVRRALAWGEADGQRIRTELGKAGPDIAGMLKLELSAEGQAAKTREKFWGREAQAVAKLVREGEREWVYLNEGTLLSRAQGDDSEMQPWNRALELQGLSDQG